MALVECQRLDKRYGKSTVLSAIDFELDRGSVTGLVGPNGSGKSTLLRVLGGLSRPSGGRVTIDGSPLGALDRQRAAVGAFLGVHSLHPGRSVRETVRLAAYLSGHSKERSDAQVEWCGLGSVAKRYVKGLSLGMKVRLGIAIATLRDPMVLLLDEPMNGLDVDGIHWIRSLVAAHKERGGCVLLSSHLLRELEVVCDRALVLDRGHLASDVVLGVLSASSERTFVEVANREEMERRLAETNWVYEQRGSGWIIEESQQCVAQFVFDARLLVNEIRALDGGALEAHVGSVSRGAFRPLGEALL